MGAIYGTIDDRCRSPARKRLRDIGMAIGRLALERHEQVALAHFAAVEGDPGGLEIDIRVSARRRLDRRCRP